MISKVFCVDFPGPGTILIGHQLTHRAPVYIDKTIKGQVEVLIER